MLSPPPPLCFLLREWGEKTDKMLTEKTLTRAWDFQLLNGIHFVNQIQHLSGAKSQHVAEKSCKPELLNI